VEEEAYAVEEAGCIRAAHCLFQDFPEFGSWFPYQGLSLWHNVNPHGLRCHCAVWDLPNNLSFFFTIDSSELVWWKL
jgi:hypothetical protein